ncbi:MAG: stage III sporulation protein AE [Blautia sp.]|nr:stage III sporulation protein AE [Blautia sp.]
MRRQVPKWSFPYVFFLFLLILSDVNPVSAETAMISDSGELLIEEMELQEVQQMLDEMLHEDHFSIKDTLKALISGKDAFSKEAFFQFVKEDFFSELLQERSFFREVLFLIFLSALFANFSAAFENTQVGEISFYVSYLFFFTLFMNSFTDLCESLSEILGWMADFMKGLAPSYFLAVAASTGASTAAAFYEGILLLTWMVQWILVELLLPGTNLYVLLCLINHMSKEEMLGKAAELTGTLISWTLKTLLGVMAGLELIRGLVSPVMDTLKRSTLGKVAGSLPGIGNAVNAVTEVLLTGAVLVKNSLGVVFAAALILVGISPLAHYLTLSLVYRFLAAVAQPISDKRLVSCMETMGEGCSFLFRIFLTAEFLCMLVLLVLNAG